MYSSAVQIVKDRCSTEHTEHRGEEQSERPKWMQKSGNGLLTSQNGRLREKREARSARFALSVELQNPKEKIETGKGKTSRVLLSAQVSQFNETPDVRDDKQM